MAMNISQRFVYLMKTLNIDFTLNGDAIDYANVFGEQGLLPAIARRADQSSLLCFGYGIGISYDEAESSLLGVKVIFDDVTPQVLRFMFLLDIVLDIANLHEDPKKVELDELLYD